MTRKNLSVIILILCWVNTFAQQDSSKYFITQGQWLMGGAISSTSLQSQENRHFRVSAYGGYFVGNRLALGLNLSYINHDKSVTNPFSGSPSANKYTIFSTDIFTRLYFRVKRFAPYGEFGFGKTLATHEGFENRRYRSEFYKTGLGLNYFLTSSVAFNGSVSYFLYPHLHNNGINYSFLRLSLGVQLFLGRNKIFVESDGPPLEKGKWMVGGTISLGDGIPSIGYRTYTLSSSVGYFVKDKIVLGTRLGNYNLDGIEAMSISVFARYYPLNKKLAPFVDLSVGNESWHEELNEQFKGSYLIIEPTIGFNYFVTNFAAIEAKVSFHRNPDIAKSVVTSQTGLQFFFSREK